MAHVHHSHSGQDLVDAAKATMERSGEQWTQMRSAVFDALASFDKPASAYDIAEKVSQNEGRRVAANSARRVESANAYIANDHPDCLHDCIFLICDNCGSARHIDNDKLTSGVRDAAKAAGFTAQRPVIEVRGRCEDCSES